MFKMFLKESLCYATNQIQRRVWSYPMIIKENGFAFVPFTLKITRYGVHWRAPINLCKISIKLSPSFKFFMVKPYFLLQKSKFENKNCYDTNLGPWVQDQEQDKNQVVIEQKDLKHMDTQIGRCVKIKWKDFQTPPKSQFPLLKCNS